MPVDSLHYAVARVKTREPRILDAEHIDRLIRAPGAAEAMRLLGEFGYGGAEGGDYETLATRELRDSAEFIESITPDERATDLFLAKGDYHNLKAAIKQQRLNGDGDDAAFTEICLLPSREIRDAVAQKSYEALPAHLALAAQSAEELASTDFDPSRVDMFLDMKYLTFALERSVRMDAFVREYFVRLTDFYNASLILRSSLMREEKDWIRSNLIDGGSIGAYAWQEVDLSADKEKPLQPLGAEFSGRFIEALESGQYWKFERYRDELISGSVKAASSELFTIRPLIAYLLMKEEEARSVRMIMAAKLNGISEEKLRERLSVANV